jgi:hypothetical protein
MFISSQTLSMQQNQAHNFANYAVSTLPVHFWFETASSYVTGQTGPQQLLAAPLGHNSRILSLPPSLSLSLPPSLSLSPLTFKPKQTHPNFTFQILFTLPNTKHIHKFTHHKWPWSPPSPLLQRVPGPSRGWSGRGLGLTTHPI